MIQGLDHVVILVHDLAAAQADYAALGFTVVPGGEHAGGQTHNALVAFADGTYLELVAFRPPAGLPDAEGPAGGSPLMQRWLARAPAGEGLLDFALRPDAIADDMAAAAERGLELAGPFPGGRRRPDGQEVAWQIAVASTPDLPFLCGDVTPRELRVPGVATHQHANGALGIAGILVGVEGRASLARYRALLGSPKMKDPHALPVFEVGTARIGLVTLDHYAQQGPLGAPDARRGEGPVLLLLREAALKPSGDLDAQGAHGARIRLIGAKDAVVFL